MVAVFRYICSMNKKRFLFCLFLVTCKISFSQIDTTFVDNKYYEDQFYFALNYNGLYDRPTDFESNTLSGGIMLGYMRDIPINKRRNVGFAIGLGYSYNNYRQNLQISEDQDGSKFRTVPFENIETNRLTLQLVELPVEFRWRTSTATKYSFWRIYAGVKFGYIFYSKQVSKNSGANVVLVNVKELDKLRYGLSFSTGYGSLNFNIYYGLNNLFKNGAETVLGEPIDLKQINVGLMFYML